MGPSDYVKIWKDIELAFRTWREEGGGRREEGGGREEGRGTREEGGGRREKGGYLCSLQPTY
jgi:hypothetical protein